MKIRCECGYVISDTSDNLPYKCGLLPDNGYWENVHEPIVRGIVDFVKAIATGKRDEWLSKHFGAGYPRDLDDESVISDFLAARMSLGPTAYQCTNCGMILIPKLSPKMGYAGFSPVDEEWKNILAWRRRDGSNAADTEGNEG
jgi:hypothetical protein